MANNHYRATQGQTKAPNRKVVFILLGVIAMCVLAVAALELANVTYIFHERKAVSGTIPSTYPTNTSVAQANENPDAPDTPKSSDKSGVPATTITSPGSITLQPPSGTFVSNHRPNLSGSPTPSQIQSVCNTSPGASCYIEFTNSGVVKKLEAQTADNNGSVYWTWDVKKAGLTVGTWTITAVASYKGDTKTATDAILLEVQKY